MKPVTKFSSLTCKALGQDSIKFQEANDCSVRAIAAIVGSYEAAHKMMLLHGRESGKGASHTSIFNALLELGLKTTRVSIRSFIEKYPTAHRNALKNVTTHHMERFPAVWKDGCTYLVFTKGHVLAVINGENVDATKGKAIRANEIYLVEGALK